MIEAAKFWLPIVGAGIFITWGITAWYSGGKVHAIWLLFGGAVCLLLLGAIQWQEDVSKPNEAGAQKPTETEVAKTRAYVSPSDAGFVIPTDNSAPTVFVVIKNTGQTPAYDLTWRAKFSIGNFPNLEGFQLDRQKIAPKSVLPPGQTLFYQWTFTEWKKEFGGQIAKGDAAAFAFGEISYKDAFGNSRFTKYRLIHGGDSLAPPGKFGTAAEGNEQN